jgi:ubiquinone/menaquinone biosynthesis C-methylase UbiE
VSRAYRDAGNLHARQSIYRYQQPRVNLVDHVMSLVDWTGRETVVDVGCGNGLYVRALRTRAARVIGMDISPGMLRDARSGLPGDDVSSLVASDVHAIASSGQVADVALANHMLYHAADIEGAVRELARVLRPGGVLLCATNGEGHLAGLSALLDDALKALGRGPVQWTRAFTRFRAENGGPLLGSAFTHVRWHPLTSTLVIDDPLPIVEYLSSMRYWLEPQVAPLAWDDCMSAVSAAVRLAGTVRITTASGAFRAEKP